MIKIVMMKKMMFFADSDNDDVDDYEGADDNDED